MQSVFVVQHLREDPDGFDDVKLIGVYSSPQNAQAAVESHRKLPGFSSYPDGFSTDEYRIDANHWNEGFVDTTSDAVRA